MTKNSLIVKQKSSRDDLIMRACMMVIGLFLAIAIILPLYTLSSKSLENKAGDFIGISNYIDYFSTPSLFQSAYNSIFISVIGTVTVLLFAFIYAYALTRTQMPFKWFFKIVAVIPLLTPSMLSGISLVYWFGNQGIAKGFLMGESIFGPIGIIMGSVYWVFPHALMIIITALSNTDARLYETAIALRTSKFKTFFMVTIPNCKFGLISAGFVVFTLIFTDFGVPKVIGGSYNVLATDIYKQIIGQQNFQMGAVVAVVLLTPAIIAFAVDRFAQRKQVALVSTSAVPYEPKKNNSLDLTMLIFCSFISFLIICMLGMAQYAAVVKFWPYNLSFTLENFNFDLVEGGGWGSYFNSIQLSLAVPGMALGLAYIFFFNNPDNPLNFLYGTMGILVISTITHFYTVSHLTATTALKQMDQEFESVSASLKTPFFRSFKKITVPICMPAILDISIYLFLNAMTTVSAVIFLYSANTRLASIAVLNMDDQGELAMAAAMAMMIAYTCGAIRILYAFGTNNILAKTQKWRIQ